MHSIFEYVGRYGERYFKAIAVRLCYINISKIVIYKSTSRSF